MKMERRQIKRLVMKNTYKFFLSLLSLCYLSCSGNKEADPSDNLTMDIGTSASVIIPAPATTLSCDQLSKGESSTGAISGAYFTVPNPRITWKNPDKVSDVRIVVLRLTLKSPKLGGEYTCTFSDLGIGALFYKITSVGNQPVAVLWDARLGPRSSSGINTTTDLVSQKSFTPCDIKCGGMAIPKNAGLFSVTGTWELLAVQKKYASEDPNETSYEEFPIKVVGSFTVDNVLD